MLARASLAQARALDARGEASAAIDVLDRLIAAGVTEPDAHVMRGGLLYVTQRFAEALPELERALVLRPGDPRALCDRGLTRLALGDTLGLEDIDQVVATQPLMGRRARGFAFMRLRRWEEARQDLEAVVAEAPPGSSDAEGARRLLDLLGQVGR